MEFVEKFLSFGGPPGPLSPPLGHVVTTVLTARLTILWDYHAP